MKPDGLNKTLREWAWNIDRELRDELKLDDGQRVPVLLELAEALTELAAPADATPERVQDGGD